MTHRLVGYSKQTGKFGIIDTGTYSYCMSIVSESKVLYRDVRVEEITNSLEEAIQYFR